MIRAGIIGATGYTGAELVRILYRHSKVEIRYLSSRSFAGEDISSVYPSLKGCVEKSCEEQNLGRVCEECDVIFAALPHGHSVPIVKRALESGVKVIDLGADFRLKNPEEYERWYGLKHEAPDLLDEAAYGLPEIYERDIEKARIVANPGCYPTSIILGLAPLLKKGVIKTESIVADSKSGVSGAGRTPSEKTHFVECNENVSAYGVSGHRHRPEIEQELEKLAGNSVRITFTPHLVPITRGILSTIYAELDFDITQGEVRELYESFYQHKPFVRILPEGVFPRTRWVYGSNFCDINFYVDSEAKRITVISAIDNLVKGASGQAVQNMNLMFGFSEVEGLMVPGLCP
ncbi:MAG TPA: N-acetyl-gamma-glutamyl-phosphate reductase [Peptococcaceae bacterium]|nr:MAG: N-acetyl-gamma-glutamyl-phosphate reductase [Clostridia bacterium 41_269]HBT20916.1 N-acetyl-gamma-glutamyl-phosphate reductase [Peptococcaceae bacterium]